MQRQLVKARDDVHEGVEAAKRMVRERCQMEEDGNDQSRSKPEVSADASGATKAAKSVAA